jgi:hypothetical protein
LQTAESFEIYAIFICKLLTTFYNMMSLHKGIASKCTTSTFCAENSRNGAIWLRAQITASKLLLPSPVPAVPLDLKTFHQALAHEAAEAKCPTLVNYAGRVPPSSASFQHLFVG